MGLLLFVWFVGAVGAVAAIFGLVETIATHTLDFVPLMLIGSAAMAWAWFVTDAIRIDPR